MRQSLDGLTPLLAQGSYEHLLQAELQRLPDLLQVVRHSPAYAELRSCLSLDEQAVISTQQHQVSTVDGTTSVVEALPGLENARLKMLALGEPLVLRGGAPITRWRMARAMEVCFLLLESVGPLRKEQIITALWPEVNEQIDQTFRSTIYYLKKALGEDLVQAQSGTYTLEKRLIWYDVEAFHNHQTQSQAALAQKNLFVAREELLHMVELYRGDYVQSFYSDWWSLRRDALRQEYLEARHELARICWQLEWVEECVTHWQHLLAVDNCLEDAHYGLMRCYFKQGKRDLALRQYQRCARFLQEELGIPPGPRIQKFHQRLLGSGT